MYDKYNPDEFIASVDAALEAGDARALKNLLKGEDLTVSDEAPPRCAVLSQTRRSVKRCADSWRTRW